MNNPKFVLVACVAALALGGILYLAYPTPSQYGSPKPEPVSPAPVACTMEAKLCPDGSYVGRSGPNCEFALCPTATTTSTTTNQ